MHFQLEGIQTRLRKNFTKQPFYILGSAQLLRSSHGAYCSAVIVSISSSEIITCIFLVYLYFKMLQNAKSSAIINNLLIFILVCAIATDSECASLLFQRWYTDDGVVAGPISAVLRVISIIKDLGPHLGLHINLSKCELFSVNDISRFPDGMKKSNVPHFDILGAPKGDFLFCAKYIAQKRTDASKLLQQLVQVGSSDPHVAMLLLRQCGSGAGAGAGVAT